MMSGFNCESLCNGLFIAYEKLPVGEIAMAACTFFGQTLNTSSDGRSPQRRQPYEVAA